MRFYGIEGLVLGQMLDRTLLDVTLYVRGDTEPRRKSLSIRLLNL
ncbi:hypothetical protein BMY_1576 [Wohlfahrtiimonas chitiniclastica]|nr:hypothetical protein [Wohlfahrtiimonas chitiniclastica]KZS23707.1 hypothetical protein BMY_1576 [Wohlfahrtiimonas chitiniclastica]